MSTKYTVKLGRNANYSTDSNEGKDMLFITHMKYVNTIWNDGDMGLSENWNIKVPALTSWLGLDS
jgi:hypothetical protein